VGRARDEYYTAAKIVNQLFTGGGLAIQYHERQQREAELRLAFAHLQKCIAELATLASKA